MHSRRPVARFPSVEGWILASLVFVSVVTYSMLVPVRAQEPLPTGALPDLSGLAWIEEDLFLAVHDAKRAPDERDLPRVSLVRLPDAEGGTWRSVDLDFPAPEGRSSDLESVSRVPGTDTFLLAESGQDTRFPRIYRATYADGRVQVDAGVIWPVPVTNVEATAVWAHGDALVFLYAERADGEPSTRIRWAPLDLDPLTFGRFHEVELLAMDPQGPGARPVVSLEIGGDGVIYVASALDPDRDDGPFRSVVWRIGRMEGDVAGRPRVALEAPVRLATLDGLKVEGLAIVEGPGEARLFVGTDDEHYGGALRPLPDAP